MKKNLLLMFIVFSELIKSCKSICSKSIHFLKKTYPKKGIAEYVDGDIIIVLGFLEGHQPVVQDLESYRRLPPHQTYAEENYIMLCPDFQNFLKVEERRSYQVKNNALVPISVVITGDTFLRT